MSNYYYIHETIIGDPKFIGQIYYKQHKTQWKGLSCTMSKP